ncbi:thioredoxin family protein [Ramlibacter monticola]|uniref:Thioredoxin family protein n=1 Tax=Ramlibacter monticola TaxID=1926872 RepID=A0A937CUA0_9BURK|nr:thioredoxin family protein [Ramlibacter monticola]MBL0391817.1 thioredoxin family protein [Ramlibacter monticola]
MKRRALLALPALSLAFAARSAPAVGEAAPDFMLKDAAGKTVRLSDYRGRFVVLEWTNPGCPFVRKHYDSGNMAATQKDATSLGAVWLSINSTQRASYEYMEPAKLVEWQLQRKVQPTATLLDEEGVTGRAYGARTTPHMYIVDPQGRLVYAGGIDSIPSSSTVDIPKAVNYVRAGLAEAVAGKPISAATTRPYGCSIKYKS